MKEKNRAVQYVTKVVFATMIILSVLASVTKIFTGFDIDEAYALAIPYRVLQGDRLFADMWEVHQTSFLVPYLFMELFFAVTGSMDGVVIFTRIVSTLLHLGVSILMFVALQKAIGKEKAGGAALLALMYYNFLPKWMINMDFSMQQLWFFTLFVICFLKACGEKDTEKQWFKKQMLWMFVAGVMLALDVLAYPGMIAVYVAAVILLFVKKEDRWSKILSLTAGCVVSALVFFICVFRYMSPAELIEAVPKVFMDGSHQYDMATKLGLYVSQWAEVLVQSAILLLPSAVVAFVAAWLYKRLNLSEKYGQLSKGLFFCIVFEILVSALISFAGLVTTWGPFRLQVRYIIQFVMAFVLWRKFVKNEEAMKEEAAQHDMKTTTNHSRFVGIILWLSLAAFVGILLASNVGPVTSASYLVIGNLVFCALTVKLASNQGAAMKAAAYTGMVLFMLSLIMCKGYYMRNTEYVPGDISVPLAKVEEGPLSGVYVPVEDHKRYISDYETIQKSTTAEDRVLFMGTEGLSNLYANGKVVIPTTISTPAFNKQWIEYFELSPEKLPTVIFIAKNTVDDRDKFFVKNVFGIWIAERYDVECMEETEFLCVLRLKEN